jgi:hypothetical protein
MEKAIKLKQKEMRNAENASLPTRDSEKMLHKNRIGNGDSLSYITSSNNEQYQKVRMMQIQSWAR